MSAAPHERSEKALMAALGVDADGYRQVLDVEVVYGETEQTWSEYLGGLRKRGLSGVRLLVSDDHAGLGKARRELRALARELAEEEGLPELGEWLEVAGEETLSCFHFPSTHRLRIRTTNGLGCGRLVTARLKEHHEDWITGRRYIDMSPLWEREETDDSDLSPAA